MKWRQYDDTNRPQVGRCRRSALLGTAERIVAVVVLVSMRTPVHRIAVLVKTEVLD